MRRHGPSVVGNLPSPLRGLGRVGVAFPGLRTLSWPIFSGCLGNYGTKTFRRTCHFVLWPGFKVTIPVSMLPQVFLLNGSAKLN